MNQFPSFNLLGALTSMRQLKLRLLFVFELAAVAAAAAAADAAAADDDAESCCHGDVADGDDADDDELLAADANDETHEDIGRRLLLNCA